MSLNHEPWAFVQSLESIPSLKGFATPPSLPSMSLESNSQALGGTSTAGEQLKNPCGCKYAYQPHKFTANITRNPCKFWQPLESRH